MRTVVTPFLARVLVVAAPWFFGAGVASAQQPVTVPCTGEGAYLACLETDRAQYAPGEPVTFRATLRRAAADLTFEVRYRHLNTVIDVDTVAAGAGEATWTWQPPPDDGRGYLAEARLLDAGGAVVDRLPVALDVSSTWARFPRYGFLSFYSDAGGQPLTRARVDAVVARLNRFHLNGLQFYDWQDKHHKPIRGTAANPAAGWRDISNRPVYVETLRHYIDAAHRRGMKAMAYNLLFGAYRNAAVDGVDVAGWGLYRDAARQQPDYHPLPAAWESDILLMDPSNPAWQDYLLAAQREVVQALPFDGWHVDQLGDRSTLYTADGRAVSLQSTYGPFLRRAAAEVPGALVMNAVNQYGQAGIASAPVEFLYTEVWSPFDTYASLRQIILENDNLGDGRLRTVLAAYMNYDRADAPGAFNAPGVLLTDAVIFASGGAHLELGEHMLAKEYFPNDNLTVSPDLDRRLVGYYDFLVAYENLLRGASTPGSLALRSTARTITPFQVRGSLWTFARSQGDRDVAHLINLADATSLAWRDNTGTQPEPRLIENLPVTFAATRPVQAVWAASPDRDGGLPVTLPFTQSNGTVAFTLPGLKYWTMVVVEYAPGGTAAEVPAAGDAARLDAPFPNPTSGAAVVRYRVETPGPVVLEVFDVLGRRVRTLVDAHQGPGLYEARWDGATSAGAPAGGGLYLCRLTTGSHTETRSLLVAR